MGRRREDVSILYREIKSDLLSRFVGPTIKACFLMRTHFVSESRGGGPWSENDKETEEG